MATATADLLRLVRREIPSVAKAEEDAEMVGITKTVFEIHRLRFCSMGQLTRVVVAGDLLTLEYNAGPNDGACTGVDPESQTFAAWLGADLSALYDVIQETAALYWPHVRVGLANDAEVIES